MGQKTLRRLCGVLLLSACADRLPAQSATGQIIGSVTDSNASLYPPAKPGALGCEPLKAAVRGR
jgi:hypothetical protein